MHFTIGLVRPFEGAGKAIGMIRFVSRLRAVAAILLMLASPATAQSRSLVPSIDPERNLIQLRDAANRPCLSLKGATRQSTINPSERSHFVVAKKSCVRRIAVKVCYFGSRRCVDFSMGSYDTKDVLLGMMTNMPAFRFNYTERELF